MVCLVLEPWAAGWKGQTKPRSYGGTPLGFFLKYLNERLGNYCRIIEFDDRDILESLKAKLFWAMILDGQMGFFISN